MQTSNLHFSFDPSKEPGQRVDINDVYIGSKKIEEERVYTLATSDYMANGKDGYDCLLEATTLVDLENSLTLKDIVLNFLGSQKVDRLISRLGKKSGLRSGKRAFR